MSLLRRRTVTMAAVIAVLSAMLAAALSPGFSTSAEAQGPTISIDPASAQVAVDGTVDVNVVIADVTGLYSATVHLHFDAAVLEVVDANPSADGVQISPGYFPGPSEGAGDVTQNVADNSAGTIDYDFALLNNAPAVSGSGTLATIRFRGKAIGPAAITFQSAELWDSSHQPIANTTADGQVQVAAAATDTPQPTATSAATSTTAPTATLGGHQHAHTDSHREAHQHTEAHGNAEEYRNAQTAPAATAADLSAASRQRRLSRRREERFPQPVPASCPPKCGAGSSSAAPS